MRSIRSAARTPRHGSRAGGMSQTSPRRGPGAEAVKVADALSHVGRRFPDTAPVIYFVERNPAFAPVVDEIFDRLDEGRLSAVTSPVTLLECLVVPCRAGATDLHREFRVCPTSPTGLSSRSGFTARLRGLSRAGKPDLLYPDPLSGQTLSELIVGGRGVTFIPLDDAIARRGAELRARYNLSLADAFQVAAALHAGCEAMLTNDVALRRVHEIPILIVSELEV